jgi:hypothetical protein
MYAFSKITSMDIYAKVLLSQPDTSQRSLICCHKLLLSLQDSSTHLTHVDRTFHLCNADHHSVLPQV